MRAYAGIGCHYMAQWMDRNTLGFTQMGGEGANWIGEAPFSKRGHVFQNIGDGTYNHSGYLAIRAAIASGTNMTYKILFNDAVAMTGGQPVEGKLTVPQIAHQVAAEGVKRVVVTSDEPEKYDGFKGWPKGTTVHHRDALDRVQRELREIPGVTVLIHDQTCAAEKRRRRKKNQFPDPARRMLINSAVCEGCGDCGVKSNCLSVHPVDTEFGRKTQIHQSSCNLDYSCLDGDCPSFLTVVPDAKRRTAKPSVPPVGPLPEPVAQVPVDDFTLRITGVGGTGVVTVAQVLATAAAIDGKHDVALMAQLENVGGQGGPWVSQGNVSVSRSTDGGIHWSEPITVFKGQGAGIGPAANAVFWDKEYIAVNNYPGTPGYGRVVVTATKFVNGLQGSYASSAIWASYSDNGGATWSAPFLISGKNPDFCTFQTTGPDDGSCDEDQFSIPEFGPDGSLYLLEWGTNFFGGNNDSGPSSTPRPTPLADGPSLPDFDGPSTNTPSPSAGDDGSPSPSNSGGNNTPDGGRNSGPGGISSPSRCSTGS